MSQHNNFTELGERPVGSLLLQYSLPAIIAMVASSLYNIVDAIFIGQSVANLPLPAWHSPIPSWHSPPLSEPWSVWADLRS